MELPKICHGELRVKKPDDALKYNRRRSSQNDVVDIEQRVGDVGTLLVNKEGHVGDRSSEARALNEAGKPLVPSRGHLLKSVQGLLQEADVVGGGRVGEARWLFTVDSLIQMIVEKRTSS